MSNLKDELDQDLKEKKKSNDEFADNVENVKNYMPVKVLKIILILMHIGYGLIVSALIHIPILIIFGWSGLTQALVTTLFLVIYFIYDFVTRDFFKMLK